MDILITTMVGLEEIALEEMRWDFGLRGKKLRNGRILVKGEPEDVVRIAYFSRIPERVMVLLNMVNGVESLQDVYNVVKSTPIEDYCREGSTFACRSDRRGNHPFTSLDIERVAGQAVVDTVKHIRVNLGDPDLVVRVDLDGDALYVALDAVGYEALHNRGYRVCNHPASLNATLASALIRAGRWKLGERLLDPFAGGGTIPIEAVLGARRVPWCKFRKFLFERNNIVGREVVEELLMEERDEEIGAVGIEKYDKHVECARRNAESAGVGDAVTFKRGDARMFDVEADVIITNPPYGQRIANPRVVHRTYYEFAERSAEMGVQRIATVTSKWKWMEDALKDAGYKTKGFPVVYGKLKTRAIVAVLS